MNKTQIVTLMIQEVMVGHRKLIGAEGLVVSINIKFDLVMDQQNIFFYKTANMWSLVMNIFENVFFSLSFFFRRRGLKDMPQGDILQAAKLTLN